MDVAHLNVIAREALDADGPTAQLRAAQTSLKKALLYSTVSQIQRVEALRLIDALRLRLASRKLNDWTL